MNVNTTFLLRAKLQKHIAECNDLLKVLERCSELGEVPIEHKLIMKKIVDLTNYKNSHAVMSRNENSRFLELMNSIPSVAIQGYNKNREVIYWNKACEDIYGYTAEEAIGQTIESLIIPEKMRDSVVGHITDWYENGNVIPAGELILDTKDKAPVYVFSSHIMLGEGTEQPEMFCVDVDLSEVAQLKVENESLEKKAHIDQLTGAYNRQYLETVIENKFNDMKSGGKELSLIMFDIDHFKKINDSHGHDVGDASLKQLSILVKASIQEDDMLIRWGGEEFMLIVEATLSEACLMANKLKETISVATELSDAMPSFTCSFGVTSMLDYESFNEAYKAADEKLYIAKNNGRNRVECCQ
ncbi:MULTISPECIES: diguanylate cyclase [Vibrio]|uniref:diguanylate cyclase n=2 Tax=Vibrio aestuarianus TaxID=28171 RepID=A0A9X4ETN7_9VIBR|nr:MULTISPECIES: diguanylate cyclase [Vibrio]MDE1230715.1 diguanylate cyclase [Vibrio aestuarianus]MDE1242199.1 diguanylate cyclase [Vibrio aestuarianus]MDE1328040.1 diguanylate cyclase [Vibrio aestuarianus]MDF9398659.1 diguanylate cyclase [Vibrio sp. 1180_3]